MPLPEGYRFQRMTREEFVPYWEKHWHAIFRTNSPIFRWEEHLSESEQASYKALGQKIGQPFTLRLAVFRGDEFAGWSVGNQQSGETYYMRNSAVLPEHRRKGIYTSMLEESLRILQAEGFQKIYSRHTATNNAVIIPKLKAGFLITSMELSDIFGILVHLSYFPNPLRRKMTVYRAGDLHLDSEIRKAMELQE